MKVRLFLALALASTVAVFLAPADASAQIIPIPGNSDYCASQSPNGQFTASKPSGTINVTAPGGRVDVDMYGTVAPCLSPADTSCPPNCSYQVLTVCEFHCYHNHIAPYAWTVQLVATPDPGQYHVGWSNADCQPFATTPQAWCIVRMNVDHNVTALFRLTPDTQAPIPFTASASSVAPYSFTLNWTPSGDETWHGGYEVFHTGTTRVARLGRGVTSYRVENLRCETSYSFHVQSYDTQNRTSSNVVPVTTGQCLRAALPRPNTVFHIKPPRVTRSRTAFFHFGYSGTQKATKYQCKHGAGRWTLCSGRTGKTYRRLKLGYHTVQVRAGNANGYDKTPATHRWRIRR